MVYLCPSRPSGPSSLVKTLDLLGFDTSSASLDPSTFANRISHLQSFSALWVLAVWEWRMTTDRMLLMAHSFGPSLENVTYLTLGHIFIHPATLAMFISHFPRLDDFSISSIRLPRALVRARDSHTEPYVGIIPTHPRGKFRALGIPTCRMPLKVFEAITLLEPRFHRIILTYVDYDAWRGYWPLVEACGESLEELRILAHETGERTRLDL